MRHIKLVLSTLLAALSLATLVAVPVFANEAKSGEPKPVGSSQRITISNKGQVEFEGAKVASISAPLITVNITWGSTVFVWNVRTSDSTKFIRRYSGASSLAEVSVGDFLSARGTLDTNSSQPTVNAVWVKDWSIQTNNSTFHGKIESIDTAAQRMVIATSASGNITVQASATTKVQRGKTDINFSDLVVGETVIAKGLYNNLTLNLRASSVTANQPKRQVFEGKLKSLPGATRPTSLVITSGSRDYTVQLAADTAVLNNHWFRANLTDFVVGNSLQVYGALRPTAGLVTTIDATIVRNLSLR